MYDTMLSAEANPKQTQIRSTAPNCTNINCMQLVSVCVRALLFTPHFVGRSLAHKQKFCLKWDDQTRFNSI